MKRTLISFSDVVVVQQKQNKNTFFFSNFVFGGLMLTYVTTKKKCNFPEKSLCTLLLVTLYLNKVCVCQKKQNQFSKN